jgi:thiaminase (transcriptional activator TenA)
VEQTVTFSEEAWESIAVLRKAVDDLPFLTGLADGTLPGDVFTHYMAQDALYLAEYGRVLASAAAQADTTEDLLFWAASARSTVAVERELHERHLRHVRSQERSPTCTAYTSYLLSLTMQGSYPVVVAGVLPCFWVYDDVGRRLRDRVGDLTAHPYGDWIATYGDPAFTAATLTARDIVDRVAEHAAPATRLRMRQAFTTAARYEWMFWDAAWRRESWPV